MPNKNNYIILIVIGFLCGLVWGAFGLTQYSPMVKAINEGDEETAQKKARNIKIATIAGIVVNIAAIIWFQTK